MKNNARFSALALLLALPAAALLRAADAPAAKADAYPLDHCVVSGETLGEMGDPYVYTYKQPGQPDRTVKFCCKMCVKKFEKDPAKYLAELDAAQAAAPSKAPAAKPAAKSN